ncbi:hypothetical protein [Nostoc sp. UHCC 0252]|nr:hypothetical protein [Nostoc sp. UHCC 0252]MEA5602342.1 hypothetical protein [Nostoc sp. UHCC 0252]
MIRNSNALQMAIAQIIKNSIPRVSGVFGHEEELKSVGQSVGHRE